MVGTNVSIFVRLLLYVIWPELRLVGDRAWALEDEVRGRANEKSGAKTKKKERETVERRQEWEGGRRRGILALKSPAFSLSLWRFCIPKNAIHPSIKLSLSRWFSHCPFQSISRWWPPLRESVHVLPFSYSFLLISLDVHCLLGRWRMMSHGQSVCECLSHIEISLCVRVCVCVQCVWADVCACVCI